MFFVSIACYFSIFAELFGFLQAMIIKHVFAKIATNFGSKFLLQLAVLAEFVILAIFAIFSIHL